MFCYRTLIVPIIDRIVNLTFVLSDCLIGVASNQKEAQQLCWQMHGLYWNSSSFRLLQNKIKFYVNNANTNYGEYVQIAKQIQAEIKELTHTKKQTRIIWNPTKENENKTFNEDGHNSYKCLSVKTIVLLINSPASCVLGFFVFGVFWGFLFFVFIFLFLFFFYLRFFFCTLQSLSLSSKSVLTEEISWLYANWPNKNNVVQLYLLGNFNKR